MGRGYHIGPLFLLYINDLPLCLNYSSTLLFADDTVVYLCDDNRDQLQAKLQEDIDAVSRWCNTDQLTVNAKKTMYQVFAPRSRSSARPSFELTFSTEMISETADYKYLGTIIDNGLTGTSQYNKVIGQVSGKIQTFANAENGITIV